MFNDFATHPIVLGQRFDCSLCFPNTSQAVKAQVLVLFSEVVECKVECSHAGVSMIYNSLLHGFVFCLSCAARWHSFVRSNWCGTDIYLRSLAFFHDT